MDMLYWIRQCRLPLGALLIFLGVSSPAQAQYYVPPVYAYNPYVGPGGTLNGAANVISAQGQYTNQIEQAKIQRQQGYQETVKTRKAMFDQMLYEQAMTPTNLEKAAKQKADRLEHILKYATNNEITSGDAQNVMLPYLQFLANKGILGPPVPLSQAVLKDINVRLDKGANIQILKKGSTIFWPLATRGPEQKKLAEYLAHGVAAAIDGSLDSKLYNAMRTSLNKVRAEVNKKSDKEEISIRAYFDSKYFLDTLSDSISMLQQPNVAKFLDGTYAARGKNVPELVQNMTDQGVVFGAALQGEEAPYRSLYNSMVTYATATESSPGFQVVMTPQGGPPKGGPPK
jgi:hypothetical protein